MALRLEDLRARAPGSKLEEAINRVLGLTPAPKSERKYRNRPTRFDGIDFHSELEARCYLELKKRELAGEVDRLILQPEFPIVINSRQVCKVVLDFVYRDKASGKVHHIDAKGMDTQLSRLKRRLVEAQYGIKVELWSSPCQA